MKKILLLAAVLGFVGVGLLTGCQKSETPTPATPEAPSTNAPAAPATNAPAAPAPAQ
jgi:uncharacterized lipoprotein YajG